MTGEYADQLRTISNNFAEFPSRKHGILVFRMARKSKTRLSTNYKKGVSPSTSGSYSQARPSQSILTSQKKIITGIYINTVLELTLAYDFDSFEPFWYIMRLQLLLTLLSLGVVAIATPVAKQAGE